jgi:hypothetical protein
VVLAAGIALLGDTAILRRRGLLAMLDREVEDADRKAVIADPVAESSDSGDDRRTDDGFTDRP